MNQERLYELTMRTIGAAMEGDSHNATVAMLTIGQEGDQADVYGACCAFAEIGKAALKKIYGDRSPDPSRGDMWAMRILDQRKAEPAEVFASRFLVAYANDDRPQTVALFRAALASSDDDYVSSVAQLLATAVGLSRTALDDKPNR